MITASETKLPRISTALPGPKSQLVIDYDKKYMSPSYMRDYPFVAERGYGAIVEDPDGNAFLDFAAGIAVCSTGHCHPKVVEAIQKQAAELIHIAGNDFYHRHMPQLAERLVKTMPKPQDYRVFFGNSGTEAVEGAIKLARYATRRDKLIAFYGCFHGRTLGSLSLTASKNTQRKGFGTLLGGVEHIPYPYAYRCALGHTKETCGGEIIELLEQQIFKRLFAPEEVAAIFVEPIQGEGGYVVAPTVFMRELRRICDRHGILLVADEVQSGVGRTGKWWAIEHTGVEPDIVCIAKGIASGMPLGVTMSKAEIMDWVPGSHASTYGGNPVAIAAALATLDVLEREGLRNAETVGTHMLERMAEWPRTLDLVGDVRGRGLMLGVEIVTDKKARTPGAEQRDKIVELAFERGVLLLGCGPNTIRLAPPLVVSKEQADIALDVLEECIGIVAKEER